MGILGRMANAPLAYVVAAVRTSAPPDFADRLAALHSAFHPKFPEKRDVRTNVMQLLPGGGFGTTVSNAIQFVNLDQTAQVTVREDLLTFETTSYTDFLNFLAELKFVFEAYAHALAQSLPIINSIGLRYLDIIVPESNQDPNEYVKATMHGIVDPFQNEGQEASVFVVQFPRPDGAMTVRYSCQLSPSGGVPLPPDIGVVNLKQSDVFRRAVAHNGRLGVLDVDRTSSTRMQFDPSELLSIFDTLHGDHSEMFKAIMSERAVTYWNEAQQ